MRAIRLIRTPEGLKPTEVEAPVPRPAEGQIQIRVHAAGVTPTELLWYPTTQNKDGSPREGAIPIHEFSGTISALGPGVTDFAVGQEIFGMNDWFSDGALADYCLTVPSAIAAKPAGLTHAEAATVPIGALTAWQGLFNHADLKDWERVLVQGGAGAVGLFAVQLAHFCGAQVVATASGANLELLKELGAAQTIDYTTRPVEDAGPVDVVFDAVGGASLPRLWQLLKPGGRLVTVAAQQESALQGRDKEAFFIVEADGQQLSHIADLIAAKKLHPYPGPTLPFSEAATAYKAGGATKRGKVAINLL